MLTTVENKPGTLNKQEHTRIILKLDKILKAYKVFGNADKEILLKVIIEP